MLTPAQRQKAFIEAYNRLIKQYGVALEASISTEQLGKATLSKPILSPLILPEWEDPEDLVDQDNKEE